MPRYITPIVRFYLQPKNGEYYIFLRLQYNRKRISIPISAKVPKRLWDAKRQRVRETGSFIDGIDINNRIEAFLAETKKLWSETRGSIDGVAFKTELEYRLGIKKRPAEPGTDIITFAREYVATRTGIKEKSLLTITKTARLIEAFHAQGAPINFEAITAAWIEDFLSYMYGRGLSINYANRIAKVVMQLMRASAGIYHNSIDFLRFKPKTEKVLPVYLTADELEKWSVVSLPLHLEKYRDFFLVACYTGLAYNEFTSITPDRISTDGGRKVINIIRQKTGANLKIPVLKALDAVLEKYSYNPPEISNQKVNNSIKDIARLAGLNRIVTIKDTSGGKIKYEKQPLHEVISSHCGRRTFATLFYLKGISIDRIRAILGHSTEVMTRRYIGTDFLEMADQFAKEVESKTNLEFA